MLKTFHGGVHPAQSKTLTAGKAIRKAPVPDKVILPLLQHTGAPCEPIVSVGASVGKGQMIAKSDKFISSPIHASISGAVTRIENYPHPVIGSFKAITIESKEDDMPIGYINKRDDISQLNDNDIRKIIKDSGIVGLGGGAFPTHVKLTPPSEKPIDSVILNGAECEPYLTCDHRLMLEKPKEILEGLKLVLRLTGAGHGYIGIENNKMSSALSLEKIIKNKEYGIRNTKTVLLKTKYPQGAEKSLIKSILNREVPPGKLPLDVGCVVINIGTALAVYEAVFLGKPLYERVVTVSGDCIDEPSNLLARIGTPVSELVKACGGFKREPLKVLFGGPMMGISQFTLDVPILKGTSGIVFLSQKALPECPETNCIRCAKCVDICPMKLLPTDIIRLVKTARYEDAVQYNISDCVECGACSYECPSKIPLLQWIRVGKSEVLKLRKKQ